METSDSNNERVEWMRTIPEEDIYLRLQKKTTHVFLFCIDIM